MADDILEEAREAFELTADAESDNREAALDDLRFARLSNQWPENIKKQRDQDGRPCLTINKLPAFIRQVVNDARQNKPSIKVHAVDSAADVEVAEIFNGLIRNIEYTSHADVAYDTATESAVGMGWGYYRIGLDYAHDDSFDIDIGIHRVADPLTIYGDPYSTAADSSDWNTAFATEVMPKAKFEDTWKGADAVNWESDYSPIGAPWVDGDDVMVAEWWRREEVERQIVALSNGVVVDVEWLLAPMPEIGIPRVQALALFGIKPQRERTAKSFKVTQTILSGAEVLQEAMVWPGRYIPIVPVYGDEVNEQGKRHFRSLIRDAKDAQQMYNFWRTQATELIALAPRVPFIGPKGAFKSDAARWATANTQSHPYLEFDIVAGAAAGPQRQPLDMGGAASSLQQALNASDDMKSIIGLYDASLGARSNETSGRAIMARQREGDVSTFHFTDNMARAIRHGGVILLDLIPKVYSTTRIVRTIGEDGTQKPVPINQPVPVKGADGQQQAGPDGALMTKVYDLSVGKYDLTVTTGPSYTTRRQEAAAEMTEMVRAYPQAAPLIGDLIAKNLDWPGADEISKRLQAALPVAVQGGLPPQVQKIMSDMQGKIAELSAENQQLKADRSIETAKVAVDQTNAQSNRIKATASAIDTLRPHPHPAPQPGAPAQF